MMYEIDVEIHLLEEGDILAFGIVTVNRCIRFPVQVRKYQDAHTGKDAPFISFPRRKRGGKWEDAVHPEESIRKEIEAAVVAAVVREVTKDLHLPKVEVVHMKQLHTHPPEGAKAKLCGLATIKVCGLTIHGITIKQGERGLFLNMPQYPDKAGEYRDLVYGTSKAMQNRIAECVIEAYLQLTKETEA